MTILLAILITATTTWLIWHITRNLATIILHLLLLVSTPWFLTLVIDQPPPDPLPNTQSIYERVSANLSYFTSDDFLFFVGDGRPGYGTGDHGVFLLSFLPLILVGASAALLKKDTSWKWPFWWLLTGLVIAVIFAPISGLPAGLWYLPSLSVLATLGIHRTLTLFKNNQVGLVIKTLIGLNGLWFIYESIRLYHVILIHQPFAI